MLQQKNQNTKIPSFAFLANTSSTFTWQYSVIGKVYSSRQSLITAKVFQHKTWHWLKKITKIPSCARRNWIKKFDFSLIFDFPCENCVTLKELRNKPLQQISSSRLLFLGVIHYSAQMVRYLAKVCHKKPAKFYWSGFQTSSSTWFISENAHRGFLISYRDVQNNFWNKTGAFLRKFETDLINSLINSSVLSLKTCE